MSPGHAAHTGAKQTSSQADKQSSRQATKQLISQAVSLGQTNRTAKLPDCDVVIQADDERKLFCGPWSKEELSTILGLCPRSKALFFRGFTMFVPSPGF